jgi:RNA polymerase sigma factor (sigma-70 family)
MQALFFSSLMYRDTDTPFLPEDIPDPAPNPEQLVLQNERQQHLRDVLNRQLSPKIAAVMQCLYFEDMDASAVALRFNITERQVKRWRYDALRVLRSNTEFCALLRPTDLSSIR